MKKLQYADLSVRKRIAYITINRPEKRNALNPILVSNLLELFDDAEKNPEAKLVILKANGEAFCAGADLEYLQQLQKNTFEENLEDSQLLKSLFEKIYTLNKVVIAQVEGHAIAGGAGLATVCDFVFSVPEANLGFTEVKIGFVPAIISMFVLRKLGEAKAKELLLTGELITANKAKALGLINYVYEAESLEDNIQSFADKMIQSCSGDSLGLTKKLIANIQTMPYAEGLEYASEMNAEARATSDCAKGIASFLDKKKILW